jgi:hypothetical protein
MNKKLYEAPKIQKVKLSIKDSIMANCHSSPNLTPKDPDCYIAVGCFNPPEIPTGG